MHNVRTNYDKILEGLDQVEPKYDVLKQIRKPKLRDKELIAMTVVQYINKFIFDRNINN